MRTPSTIPGRAIGQKVGVTKGRGRQDRFKQAALSIKAIYVYPIEKKFRKRIGLSADAGLGALTPAQGLENEHWAENEFGGAPLGDARLSKRLVNMANILAPHRERTVRRMMGQRTVL